MGGGERDSWGIWDGHVHMYPYLKWISPKTYCIAQGTLQCYVAAWMGGEFGGEWIHVYAWLRPFAVNLKLSQHY